MEVRVSETIQSVVQTAKKESEVFIALRVNRNTNQIERSSIAPYSLFTRLSPECQTTSTHKLSLSSLQPLWKNNNTSKYWGRAAVRISRQYASVAAGGFILISNLIEFSPSSYIDMLQSMHRYFFQSFFFFFWITIEQYLVSHFMVSRGFVCTCILSIFYPECLH